MSNLDTDFWWLSSPVTFPQQLLEELKWLPIREDVEFRFIDFDGTLANDKIRFQLDPELLCHRGNDAIPYIMAKYSTEDDPTGIKNFVKKLIEKLEEEGRWFLFDNVWEIFDPNNPNDFILTAWDYTLQNEKIESSWLPKNVNKILVEVPWDKPLQILETCLRKGFIPWKIKFYDDRIKNFEGVDEQISRALKGIPVEFFIAIPEYEKNRVLIERYSGQVGKILSGN